MGVLTVMKKDNCLKCHKIIEGEEALYGLHPLCFKKWFSAKNTDEFLDVVRQQSSSDDSAHPLPSDWWNSSFFQGKFLKYSAELAGQAYIIKLEEDMAPELPFVEYLCHQIASSVGIETPTYYCILFYGRPAFVSKNLLDKNSRIKILTHIYHYVKSGEEYQCETLINIILNKTKHSGDVDKFIDICLYDSLIGNHDRHGRNLGLIIDASGTSLCPAYDNTSALGLEHGDILKAQFNPTGKIATKETLEPTAKDYGIRETLEQATANVV